MTALDLSSYAGLTAMVLLTMNVLLGILLSRNYNPRRRWPNRKIPIFRIHNWAAYVALVLILVHPALLLFNTSPVFRLTDLLYPLHSPAQSNYNTLGAITLYGLLVVIVTSYFRPQLGSRPWKKIHYTAYSAAALMFLHGTLIDPELKGHPPDLLDGEKVLVEGCFLAIVAASIWRVRQKKKLI